MYVKIFVQILSATIFALSHTHTHTRVRTHTLLTKMLYIYIYSISVNRCLAEGHSTVGHLAERKFTHLTK